MNVKSKDLTPSVLTPSVALPARRRLQAVVRQRVPPAPTVTGAHREALRRRHELPLSAVGRGVSDFTEGTHPISTKWTTQFSGAKRRSDLELFTLSLLLFSTLFFCL